MIANPGKFHNDKEFQVRVVKQMQCGATLEWNLLEAAEVYKVEKHHPHKGWLKVGWTTQNQCIVMQLERNFGYLFRILALRFDDNQQQYISICTSNHVVACTLAALPTAIHLHRAISKGQVLLVKRIIRQHPTLLEVPGPNGYLPLANAIAFGDIGMMDALLSFTTNIHNPINHFNQRTLLHQAFYYGRTSIARILLNKKADLQAKDIYGATPCHLAIDTNQYDVLKIALENQANVNAADDSGWTLLMRAVVMEANLNILKLLVKYGANINSLDMMGLNAIDLARVYQNHTAQSYLLANC